MDAERQGKIQQWRPPNHQLLLPPIIRIYALLTLLPNPVIVLLLSALIQLCLLLLSLACFAATVNKTTTPQITVGG